MSASAACTLPWVYLSKGHQLRYVQLRPHSIHVSCETRTFYTPGAVRQSPISHPALHPRLPHGKELVLCYRTNEATLARALSMACRTQRCPRWIAQLEEWWRTPDRVRGSMQRVGRFCCGRRCTLCWLMSLGSSTLPRIHCLSTFIVPKCSEPCIGTNAHSDSTQQIRSRTLLVTLVIQSSHLQVQRDMTQ